MKYSKGKFTKKIDKGLKIELNLASVKKTIFSIILIWILIPIDINNRKI